MTVVIRKTAFKVMFHLLQETNDKIVMRHFAMWKTLALLKIFIKLLINKTKLIMKLNLQGIVLKRFTCQLLAKLVSQLSTFGPVVRAIRQLLVKHLTSFTPLELSRDCMVARNCPDEEADSPIELKKSKSVHKVAARAIKKAATWACVETVPAFGNNSILGETSKNKSDHDASKVVNENSFDIVSVHTVHNGENEEIIKCLPLNAHMV